jgi:hypothetical protein
MSIKFFLLFESNSKGYETQGCLLGLGADSSLFATKSGSQNVLQIKNRHFPPLLSHSFDCNEFT